MLGRRKEQPKNKVPGVSVVDLDALISEPVFFTLHGKTHEIKPINTVMFYKFSLSLNEFFSLSQNESQDKQELLNKAVVMIQSIAPSLKYEDIEQCTQPQLNALFQLILDSVAGRTQDIGKKKTELTKLLMKSEAMSLMQ